jgi:hypothetical protein
MESQRRALAEVVASLEAMITRVGAVADAARRGGDPGIDVRVRGSAPTLDLAH